MSPRHHDGVDAGDHDVLARDGVALSYDVARFDTAAGAADFVAIFRAYAAYFTQGLLPRPQPHTTPSAPASRESL